MTTSQENLHHKPKKKKKMLLLFIYRVKNTINIGFKIHNNDGS